MPARRRVKYYYCTLFVLVVLSALCSLEFIDLQTFYCSLLRCLLAASAANATHYCLHEVELCSAYTWYQEVSPCPDAVTGILFVKVTWFPSRFCCQVSATRSCSGTWCRGSLQHTSWHAEAPTSTCSGAKCWCFGGGGGGELHPLRCFVRCVTHTATRTATGLCLIQRAAITRPWERAPRVFNVAVPSHASRHGQFIRSDGFRV
jgi:hypothetical protein